jgi:putative transposase
VIRHVLRAKAADVGSEILALNMVSDHVHVALSIPPSLAPAHLIGEMKGASSHQVNATAVSPDTFHWQSAYGLLTVSPKDLVFVVRYIENQKQHHAEQSVVEALERDNP